MENPDSTVSRHRRGPSHDHGDDAVPCRAMTRGRVRAMSRPGRSGG